MRRHSGFLPHRLIFRGISAWAADRNCPLLSRSLGGSRAGWSRFAREESRVSFYCLFGEGKPHLLGGPGPAVRVFQKILGPTANAMDRFGHLAVCVRAPPGCVRVCACVPSWRAPHLGVCGCWHPGSHMWPWPYLSGAAFARRGLEFSTQSCKPGIAMISSSRGTNECQTPAKASSIGTAPHRPGTPGSEKAKASPSVAWQWHP